MKFVLLEEEKEKERRDKYVKEWVIVCGVGRGFDGGVIYLNDGPRSFENCLKSSESRRLAFLP